MSKISRKIVISLMFMGSVYGMQQAVLPAQKPTESNIDEYVQKLEQFIKDQAKFCDLVTYLDSVGLLWFFKEEMGFIEDKQISASGLQTSKWCCNLKLDDPRKLLFLLQAYDVGQLFVKDRAAACSLIFDLCYWTQLLDKKERDKLSTKMPEELTDGERIHQVEELKKQFEAAQLLSPKFVCHENLVVQTQEMADSLDKPQHESDHLQGIAHSSDKPEHEGARQLQCSAVVIPDEVVNSGLFPEIRAAFTFGEKNDHTTFFVPEPCTKETLLLIKNLLCLIYQYHQVHEKERGVSGNKFSMELIDAVAGFLQKHAEQTKQALQAGLLEFALQYRLKPIIHGITRFLMNQVLENEEKFAEEIADIDIYIKLLPSLLGDFQTVPFVVALFSEKLKNFKQLKQTNADVQQHDPDAVQANPELVQQVRDECLEAFEQSIYDILRLDAVSLDGTDKEQKRPHQTMRMLLKMCKNLAPELELELKRRFIEWHNIANYIFVSQTPVSQQEVQKRNLSEFGTLIIGTNRLTISVNNTGVIKMHVDKKNPVNIEIPQLMQAKVLQACVFDDSKGLLAIGGQDGAIYIVDLFQRACKQVLCKEYARYSYGFITALHRFNENYLAVGYMNGRVVIWDLIKNKVIQNVQKIGSNAAIRLITSTQSVLEITGNDDQIDCCFIPQTASLLEILLRLKDRSMGVIDHV